MKIIIHALTGLFSLLFISSHAHGHGIGDKPLDGALNMTPPVSCSITTTDDKKVIQVSLTNQSSHTWQLLSWHTPFDAWFSRFMSVTVIGGEKDGEIVPYQGALAKRGAPNAEDYLQLAAKTSLSVTLDLAQAYELPSADYLITINPFELHQVDNKSKSFTLACPTIKLAL
ncbi:hypothetical protein [Shewanella sp. SR44-3]|uniref:hypothetical protein n=1 Tax=Shewanella sp. SR44-3 TaxID=2760936 RepID=UPI0015FB570D|nr:hypothetical protein [Shewanella sp. SR44-3]MBB1268171.1 hypothetical protein [Shewanella sp. SR44-3]